MDTPLYIDLPKIRYAPGETVAGTIFWVLEEPPQTVRLTLGWWTEGRGTRDAAVEATREWKTSALAGEERFELQLSPSPYSFSGPLITLKWALELSTEKGKQTAMTPLVVSPGDEAIELVHLDEGRKQSVSLERHR